VSIAHHEHRTSGVPEVGMMWTDYSSDVLGFAAVHHRELHVFLRVGQEFGGSLSRGSRPNMYLQRCVPMAGCPETFPDPTKQTLFGDADF
jgi:hypothetical protein